MKKLTTRKFGDAWLRSLTSEGKPELEVSEPDTPGFSVKVTKGGQKTFRYLYVSPVDKRRKRITLGTFPATAIAVARARAIEARGVVEAGKDPKGEEEEKAKSSTTVAQLKEDYLADVRGAGLRTADDIDRRLTKDVVSVVGDVPVRDFNISHLNMVLNPVKKRGARVMYNHVLSDTCRMFGFAQTSGLIEHHPIPEAIRKKLLNDVTPRTRNLSREEIVAVWAVLETKTIKSAATRDALMLCLVTGQRIGEVLGMTKAELRLDKRLWSIPAARVKNKHDHAVPLSDMALGIIRRRLDEAKGEYLFPHRIGNGPLPVEAVAHNIVRAHKNGHFDMPKWTAHDLRRTVITQMRRKDNLLGISRFASSLVVNHRSGTKESVTDTVYDQNDYLDEKREALDKWARFLTVLLAGDKVVQLPVKAA